MFSGRQPRQDVKILRRFVPIFRRFLASPRNPEHLQLQILSEESCFPGYDSVSPGGLLPTQLSASIYTAPVLAKTHCCATLLTLEDVGCLWFWKVVLNFPHNSTSYPTQILNPQKLKRPNLTRNENYNQSDVNLLKPTGYVMYQEV